jgi:hypothetical protein
VNERLREAFEAAAESYRDQGVEIPWRIHGAA